MRTNRWITLWSPSVELPFLTHTVITCLWLAKHLTYQGKCTTLPTKTNSVQLISFFSSTQIVYIFSWHKNFIMKSEIVREIFYFPQASPAWHHVTLVCTEQNVIIVDTWNSTSARPMLIWMIVFQLYTEKKSWNKCL